mmetsp:Transcript_38103/g.46035  ORF Transcript_38103/g.46035 Transcript_38103/m.46035 type:complete len:159 (-) Transcript_38103:116-592(-)
MDHLKRKYGQAAIERYGRPGNPLDLAGQKVGIHFNPARRVIPTRKAHRFMEYTKTIMPERQDEIMNVLFEKYFEKGEDLSKADALLECADQVGGLDLEGVNEAIGDDTTFDAVIATKDAKNRQMRISGVPYFIMGGHKVSGAQPSEIFEEILTEMAQK